MLLWLTYISTIEICSDITSIRDDLCGPRIIIVFFVLLLLFLLFSKKGEFRL